MSARAMKPAPPAAIRVSRLPPPGLTALHLPKAERELMERVAVDVWTAMVNQGRCLQDTILAVYLSGLNHGYCAAQEARNPPEFSPEFSPAASLADSSAI